MVKGLIFGGRWPIQALQTLLLKFEWREKKYFYVKRGF
jgi:hypothetical protein